MKKNLQANLCKKYPSLFQQHINHDKKSTMPFGIETDDGWYKLIDTLCMVIKKVETGDLPTQIIQIKQKFGGLRFYVGKANAEVFGAIRMAEEMSYNICEHCGSTDNVKRRKKGFVYTLCDKCVEGNAK